MGRVRVSLDLVQPLQRGQMVSLEEVADGEPLWVAFQYERLPTFIYCCGCIGHGDRECHLWESNKAHYRQHGFPYGQWLRAPPAGRLPAAKAVVHPPHQRLKVLQLILPRILEFRSRMLHVYLHMSRNTMPH